MKLDAVVVPLKAITADGAVSGNPFPVKEDPSHGERAKSLQRRALRGFSATGVAVDGLACVVRRGAYTVEQEMIRES